VERSRGNGEGCESDFRGFAEEDTRSNTVGHTGGGSGYRCDCCWVELRRNVLGGLGSESKKWELVVGGT